MSENALAPSDNCNGSRTWRQSGPVSTELWPKVLAVIAAVCVSSTFTAYEEIMNGLLCNRGGACRCCRNVVGTGVEGDVGYPGAAVGIRNRGRVGIGPEFRKRIRVEGVLARA